MNASTNRRRILAASCLLGLSVYNVLITIERFVAGPPTHGAIAMVGFLAVLHAGLIAGAVFGIAHLVRHQADRLGLTGAALAILGATVAARIMAMVQIGVLQNAADPGAVIGTVHQSAPIVWVSLVPIGLMFPIGLMTLGAAIFIARPVYRWIGALLAAGGFLFPLGRAVNITPALPASDVALALAFGLLGRAVLTRPELWEGSDAAPAPEFADDTLLRRSA